MKKYLNMWVIYCFVIILAGCAKTVHTDYDQSIDFKTLKTYNILQTTIPHTGHTMLDSPLMQKRVVFHLHQLLKTHHYNESSPADFYIDTGWSVKKDYEQAAGMSYGFGMTRGNFGMAMSTPQNMREITKAVLTISMYTRKKDKSSLIWRGSSDKRLSQASTTAADHDILVRDMLEVILKEFPPR